MSDESIGLFDTEVLCDKRRERERDEKMAMEKEDSEYDIWFPISIDLRQVSAIRKDDDGEAVVFLRGGHALYVKAKFEEINQAWKKEVLNARYESRRV